MKTAVLCFVALFVGSSIATDQVVCYYTNVAIYRPEPAKFNVSDVDPNLCTIINYAFISLWANGSIKILNKTADFDLGQLEGVVALKEQKSDLKVLASMGGYDEGSEIFTKVAGNDTLRAVMVKSVVDFVQKYGFDGMNLDWEYPSRRGGYSHDRENFCILVKELKEALTTANSSYLLTADVLAAGSTNISQIYDAANLTNYLDYVNLMFYDLYTPDDVNYTFQGAAVSATTVPSKYQSAYNQELSVIAGLKAWISQGLNPSKINLGIPFYGHSWTLANPRQHELYADTTGPGTAGPLLGSAGTWSYQEICLYNTNYTVIRDFEVISPYQYYGDQWVSYDDPKSVAYKTKLAIKYGLAGVMMWALDLDDFNDSCGTGRYPLLSAVNNVINGSSR